MRASPYSERDILVSSKVDRALKLLNSPNKTRKMEVAKRFRLLALKKQITSSTQIVRDKPDEMLKQIIALQSTIKAAFPRNNVPLDCCMHLLASRDTHGWVYCDQIQGADTNEEDSENSESDSMEDDDDDDYSASDSEDEDEEDTESSLAPTSSSASATSSSASSEEEHTATDDMNDDVKEDVMAVPPTLELS